MKIIKTILVISLLLGLNSDTEAQFGKRLGKVAQRAAERTVERKVAQKVEKETSEAIDEVFEAGQNDDKRATKKLTDKNKTTNNTTHKEGSSPDDVEDFSVKTAKDFERGNKIIFQETHQKVAIGDFPGTWNTTGSGEVVTIGNSNTRWLKITSGLFMPEGLNAIPENSTVEMDIYQTTNHLTNVSNLKIMLAALNDKNTEFTSWKDGWGKEGVVLYLCQMDSHGGAMRFWNQINKKTVLKTSSAKTQQFSVKKKMVHLSFWRQGNRLRIYLDDVKVYDLPRAFAGQNYNSLIFSTNAPNETPFFVSNIVVATDAGADTRHKLLETGSFTTNDILFETGSANIEISSFDILDEIAEVMISNPSKQLTIIGHTDSDGSAESNQALSEKRAKSVKDYLVIRSKISADRITTLGRGESQPVANGNTADAKAQNRRVEFRLK